MRRILIPVVIVILIFLSGCINSYTQDKKINYIKPINYIFLTLQNISYDEIVSINYTETKDKLESIGYIVRVDNSTYFDFTFTVEKYNKTVNNSVDYYTIISLGAWRETNETKKGRIIGNYDPTELKPEHEENLTLAKEFYIEKINEFAKICNITLPLPWENASWSVNYQELYRPSITKPYLD